MLSEKLKYFFANSFKLENLFTLYCTSNIKYQNKYMIDILHF